MLQTGVPYSQLALPAVALLQFKDRLFPLHSGCAAKSSVLESLLRQASKQGPGGAPVVALDSTQLLGLEALVGPLTPLGVERFLAALSGAALERSCSEVEQVVQILKLADWFDAHELRSRCDQRLCELLQGLWNRQQVNDSREEAAAMALEAGVQHYLTKTVGWLLPWALQQLSRGDKVCGAPGSTSGGSARSSGGLDQMSGELQSGQASAWVMDRQVRRRRRLHAALMGDDQLKIVLMEQQWWAQGADYEDCCACDASPADLRPAYDVTGEAWLWSRDGASYRRAADHFAHCLTDRCWGLTPSGGGFAPAPMIHHHQHGQGHGAEQQGAFWPAGLTRSMSSVGQHV